MQVDKAVLDSRSTTIELAARTRANCQGSTADLALLTKQFATTRNHNMHQVGKGTYLAWFVHGSSYHAKQATNDDIGAVKTP